MRSSLVTLVLQCTSVKPSSQTPDMKVRTPSRLADRAPDGRVYAVPRSGTVAVLRRDEGCGSARHLRFDHVRSRLLVAAAVEKDCNSCCHRVHPGQCAWSCACLRGLVLFEERPSVLLVQEKLPGSHFVFPYSLRLTPNVRTVLSALSCCFEQTGSWGSSTQIELS